MFPLVGSLVGLTAMAPGVYLRFLTKRRWPPTMMVLAVMLLLFLVFQQPSPVAVYFFEFGLSSLILDDLLQRRRPGMETIFLSAAIAALLVAGLVAGLAWNRGVAPALLANEFLSANISGVVEVYRKLGVSPDQLKVLQEAAAGVAAWGAGLFPTLLMIAFTSLQGLGYYVARFFYRRRHGHFPEILAQATGFAYLQLPHGLVWLLIAAFGGLLVLPLGGGWQFVMTNLAGILAFAYLVQGLSIIRFAFVTLELGAGARFLFFFLLFTFQFLLVFVVLLGVFDIWLDFRSRLLRHHQG